MNNIIVSANGAETTTATIPSTPSTDKAMILINGDELHIQAPTDGFKPAQAGTVARIVKDQVNAAIASAKGKRVRMPGKDSGIKANKQDDVYSVYLPETKPDDDIDAAATRLMNDIAQWMVDKAAPGPAPAQPAQQTPAATQPTRQQPQQTPAATQPTRQQPQQTPQNQPARQTPPAQPQNNGQQPAQPAQPQNNGQQPAQPAQQTPPAQPQNNGQQPAQPQPQPQQPQQQTPAPQPTRQQPQPPALEPVPWDDPNWNADNWVAQQLGF